MHLHAFLSLLLVSVLLVTSSSESLVHATSMWSTQTIDKNGAIGPIAISIDSNNDPHILYCDYENGYYQNPIDVMYASWDGSSWSSEVVTQGRGTIDLALDSNNNPHIIYNDDPTGGILMYASWTGSNWAIQTVDNHGTYGSLQLDSNGNPHIAYIGFNGTLNYATWTGTNWNIQTVDSSETFNQVSLVLDSNDYPHILYGQNVINIIYLPNHTEESIGYETVKYAVWNGSSWNIETLLPNTVRFGNLVLDSNGYPHFAYVPAAPNSGETIYTSWNGSSWNNQTMPLFPSDIVLDSRGYPHFIGTQSAPYTMTLMYGSWTGKAWSIQTVYKQNAVGGGALALDPNGNPHIAYGIENPQFDQYVDYLNYATTTEPSATNNTLPTVDYLWLIAVPALIVITVTIVLYTRKKRTKNTKIDIAK